MYYTESHRERFREYMLSINAFNFRTRERIPIDRPKNRSGLGFCFRSSKGYVQKFMADGVEDCRVIDEG